MFAEEETEVQGDRTSKGQKGVLIRIRAEPGAPEFDPVPCPCLRGGVGCTQGLSDSLPPDANVPTALCGECPTYARVKKLVSDWEIERRSSFYRKIDQHLWGVAPPH